MRLLCWDPTQLGPLPGAEDGTDGELDDDALAALYRPPVDRPWLRANMVSTLDGSAVDARGLSGGINTPADQAVFGLLRAFAQVVLVGAGTVRAEGYRRLRHEPRWQEVRRRAGWATPPVLAVVSASADVPERVVDTSGDEGELVVITGPQAPRRRLAELRDRLGSDAVIRLADNSADHLPGVSAGSGGAALSVRSLVQALAERGWTGVLCEGGPRLLGTALREGVLDELCLTVTPLLIGGDGGRIVTAAGLNRPARLVALVEQDGTVMGRWFTR